MIQNIQTHIIDELTLHGFPTPEGSGWSIWDDRGRKVTKKSIRKKFREMYNETGQCDIPATHSVATNSLGPFQTTAMWIDEVPKTWSTNMYQQEMKVQEITSDDKAREHLRERLRDVFCSKDHDLRKKYGLTQDIPQTRKALADALKNGQYTIEGLTESPDKEFSWFDGWSNMIRFTLVPEDRKGYDAAYQKLTDAREATRDMIVVSSPADGLKAFREFEATTFS